MRICIIYGTKKGSTEKIAEWMKEEFEKERIDVDLIRAGKSKMENFDYDLFIIGSPIYWEKPLKSVDDFLSRNGQNFAGRKVAVFVVCLADMFGHFTRGYIKKHYILPLEEKISGDIIGKRFFRGWLKKINPSTRKEVEKWVRDLMKETELGT